MEDLKEIFAQKGFSLCSSSASVALYHALLCRRWKTGALLVTLRWESWLEKSRRCLASQPLQNLGPFLMALLVYSAQQLPAPNVAVFWEVGSLVVPAMTKLP